MTRRGHINDLARDLAQIPGFAGCSRKQLELVDQLCDRVSIRAGETVLCEGSFGSEAYVIVSGTVSVTKRGHCVTTLGPGDHFGELSAIENGRRNATLTALGDLELLVMGPRELGRLVAEVSGFRDILLRTMVRRLRAADDTARSSGMRTGAASLSSSFRVA